MGRATHLRLRLEMGRATHLRLSLEMGRATHLRLSLETGRATHLRLRLEMGRATHLRLRLEMGRATHLRLRLEMGRATHLRPIHLYDTHSDFPLIFIFINMRQNSRRTTARKLNCTEYTFLSFCGPTAQLGPRPPHC
jgi:hypothetical protein